MANYYSKYKGDEIETLLDKQNAMPSPTVQDEGKVLSVDATGVYELRQPQIDDGSITQSKIADGAVTTVKLGDGAVTESKLDVSVSSKINNTVNLTGDQVIAGSKNFTDGIETESIFGDTLSVVADGDGEVIAHGDLHVEAEDDILVYSERVELNLNGQLNVEASDVYLNEDLAVDGNLSVIGSIHASANVYSNNKELAKKEYVDTGLATKQDAMASLTTAEINSICV